MTLEPEGGRPRWETVFAQGVSVNPPPAEIASWDELVRRAEGAPARLSIGIGEAAGAEVEPQVRDRLVIEEQAIAQAVPVGLELVQVAAVGNAGDGLSSVTSIAERGYSHL